MFKYEESLLPLVKISWDKFVKAGICGSQLESRWKSLCSKLTFPTAATVVGGASALPQCLSSRDLTAVCAWFLSFSPSVCVYVRERVRKRDRDREVEIEIERSRQRQSKTDRDKEKRLLVMSASILHIIYNYYNRSWMSAPMNMIKVSVPYVYT